MRNTLLPAFLIAAAVAGFGYADQQTSKVVIPIERISPANGKQMYVDYCAPCHGANAKGNGPAASALRNHPTDLTVLSRNNHGHFPDTHIAAVLRFGSALPAHGSAQMPVWGPILGKMDTAHSQATQLRISNLCRYLESLQVH
ncbi:MAG TPA: c-type cytochrome [Terracidiphilus sp.]|nr:c-type cytochrome [Terracidiphilus sp.]